MPVGVQVVAGADPQVVEEAVASVASVAAALVAAAPVAAGEL